MHMKKVSLIQKLGLLCPSKRGHRFLASEIKLKRLIKRSGQWGWREGQNLCSLLF